ncbi:hypothetical protein D3C71_1317950 [compost metagenome]
MPATSTSVMPLPSVPGSHAATKACDWLSRSLVYIGRPEKYTVTTGLPLAWAARSTARSCG